jgi:hypothetical protein
MSKRSRIILTGIIPILLVSTTILGIGLGGRLPGLSGEIFRKITGFMFTPVFLELTFAFPWASSCFFNQQHPPPETR